MAVLQLISWLLLLEMTVIVIQTADGLLEHTCRGIERVHSH